MDCGIAYWGLAMSLRPNPLVPPFPKNLLKEGWEAVQEGKAAKNQTPKEAAYLAAMELFYRDYDTVDQRVRAQAYSSAMNDLHQRYPEDSEAAIFYALSLLETVDFSDKKYGNQLKAAEILNAQAKDHPKHPGIAHYLIHSYDFAPLAAMCVDTARLYDKIAANSPHALHMPSHIYSMLGMWDDSIRSNLASEALANGYAAKAYPGATDAQVPHDLDFLMYAYLQQGRDNEAQEVISRTAGINKMAVVRLTVDTALAAVPARYVIERRAWNEAAALTVRESQYPAARSVTYFTRGLGAARGGDLASAVEAWIAFAEKRVDDAIETMRTVADLDDASEKNVAMENKLLPMRALLGELYLAAGRNKEALPELEKSLKVVPGRYATIAAAAQAARNIGQADTAKRYYRALIGLTNDRSSSRPELAEAKQYLAQK